MIKITKKDIIDNLLACLLGLIVYIIARILIPTISLNSLADILLFIISYLVGSTVYFLIKKKDRYLFLVGEILFKMKFYVLFKSL